MKLLLPLLLAPVLSLAAATGSVTLLDGTPVSGAVIKSLTDSVVTSATGSFALGRTSGISPRSTKTIPVTSHLTVENERPRLTFAGMDIAGRALNGVRYERTPGVAQAQSLKGAIGTRSTFAARSTGTPDTLKVYWKGKRLTVLPVTSDTTVTFRIDTAWKDDAGIPWNPRVAYGSLFDARDGQTYRTVTIGTQTWMAENLDYDGSGTSIGRCYEDISANCLSYGRLYSSAEAMGIDTSFNNKLWQGTAFQGICPSEWHVPSSLEWRTLLPEDFSSDTVTNEISLHTGWNITGGKRFKATAGWFQPGLDEAGMRIVNSGLMATGAAGTRWLPDGASFRVSTENTTHPSVTWHQIFDDSTDVSGTMSASYKPAGLSIRCLKD